MPASASVAGYSTTPLPKKLGIGAGSRVALVSAPKGFLDPLPPGASVVSRGTFDVAVAFCDARTSLSKRLPGLYARMAENGGLWIAWPKKSSGVKTDLSEDVVRELGLAIGLVDNKVCAIDETWSGLRLVIRVADRKRR